MIKSVILWVIETITPISIYE